MSSELLAALVGGLIVAIAQWLTLRATLAAEFQRLRTEHQNQIRAATLEFKRRFLVERIAKILRVTDFEISDEIDYASIVQAINEAQLTLDPRLDPDAAVSKSLNALGHASNSVRRGEFGKHKLLEYQAALTESVQRLVNARA